MKFRHIHDVLKSARKTLAEVKKNPQLAEAATLKSMAQRLMKDIQAILDEKELPANLRKQIEDVRKELKKTWAELANEAPAKAEESGQPVSGDPVSAECYDDGAYAAPMAYNYTPWGAKTFADLDAARAANEASAQMHEVSTDLQYLISSIMGDTTDTDKLTSLKMVFDEALVRIADILGVGLSSSEGDPAPVSGDPAPLGEAFAENIGGGAFLILSEATPLSDPPSTRDPLDIDVRLIQPGWGNSVDNHYYPADVLRRDAKVFERMKMYTTDHRENERSVRTEVARINKIVRYDEAGAPIANVTIFDPGFAEQTRNRIKANALDTLECSILAYGKSKPGVAPDGRKGNIVESITSARSVDWVTRAGAGGQAIGLSENDPQPTPHTGVIMLDKATVLQVLSASGLPEAARKRLGEADYADRAALDSAITEEANYIKSLAEANGGGQSGAAPATAPAQPVMLSEAEVTAELNASHLPQPARQKLAGKQYASKQVLGEAIQREVAYLKEVTGSGRPVTMPAAQPINTNPAPKPLAETHKAVDALVTKRFGIQPAPARA